MSPIVIILKEEQSSNKRTIAYETFKKESVVILQQEFSLNEWITVNHMTLPVVIFDYVQSFRFEKDLMKGHQYTLDFVTSYIREFNFDPQVLNQNVRKFLYDYDLKKIALYENQEGYWRDLELIENLWKLQSIESPEHLFSRVIGQHQFLHRKAWNLWNQTQVPKLLLPLLCAMHQRSENFKQLTRVVTKYKLEKKTNFVLQNDLNFSTLLVLI